MPKKLSLKRTGKNIRYAQQIIATAMGFRAARVLMAAHQTGVFEHLAKGPASSLTLATELNLDPDLLERVLIACAAQDLLRPAAWSPPVTMSPATPSPVPPTPLTSNWELTDKARATLLRDSPVFQGDLIAHMAGVWDFWNDLEHLLRKHQGASTFLADATRKRDHRAFILAMHNLASAGRAADLTLRVDLAGKKTLLDVGGGPGTYSMLLCERFPDLHATLFDMPETIAIAREVVAAHGLSDRISFREGNWDEDDFGTGYDVILMSNILHGPPSGAPSKLAKAFAAMNPAGLLILQDFLLNPEKTGPLLPALFNIMVGAFSTPELITLTSSAGFTHPQSQEMSPESGQTLITAIKEA
ncbi:MAG: methyltransferase [Bacillota bacterium]